MSFILSNPNSPQNRVQSPPFVSNTTPPLTMQLNQFNIGDIWIDSSSDVVYVLTSVSNGQLSWVNTVPASAGSFSSISVTPGPSSFTGTTTITGATHITGNTNAANTVFLEENGGASGTITIESLQGTGVASIGLHSVSGGIQEITDASGADITLNANQGSIGLAAGEDVAQAVFISAGGGTAATMQMVNITGTNDALTIANSALYLASTAGGVGINAGLSVQLEGAAGAATDISLTATAAGGGITCTSDTGGFVVVTSGLFDVTAAGGFDLDITGAIALDATLASNFSVTGAAQDLTLQSAGGSVNVLASEAIADAIVVNASSGGFEIDGILASHVTVTGAAQDLLLSSSGGSVNVTASEAISDAISITATGAGGGIQIGQTATTASVAIANITPTVSRTTTINGAIVNTAHTDLVSIADGGVSTSGSAEKEVTIATGATAVGLTLVSIATGNISAAGNTTLNLATGNAPAGTTQAISLGTGTGGGTKSISIGNADGLTTISELGIMDINTSGTAITVIGSTATGGAVAINSASTITSLAPNFNVNNSGTGATTIGSATGGTIILESNTAAANAIQINAHAATGGVLITAGTGATAGNVSITPATLAGTAGPSATVSSTLNARVGNVTYAGYTQAAAATLTITLTNSFITATSVIFAQMTDVSSNTTGMQLLKINPGAGSAVITFINNGSQAVNGNLQLNFWVLS